MPLGHLDKLGEKQSDTGRRIYIGWRMKDKSRRSHHRPFTSDSITTQAAPENGSQFPRKPSAIALPDTSRPPQYTCTAGRPLDNVSMPSMTHASAIPSK
jgi:hypothetical protein